MIHIHFNSHAHVERDIFDMVLVYSFNNFNSHAHVERDEDILSGINIDVDFNSHAHVERDCSKVIDYVHEMKFQLTRSRGA